MADAGSRPLVDGAEPYDGSGRIDAASGDGGAGLCGDGYIDLGEECDAACDMEDRTPDGLHRCDPNFNGGCTFLCRFVCEQPVIPLPGVKDPVTNRCFWRGDMPTTGTVTGPYATLAAFSSDTERARVYELVWMAYSPATDPYWISGCMAWSTGNVVRAEPCKNRHPGIFVLEPPGTRR